MGELPPKRRFRALPLSARVRLWALSVIALITAALTIYVGKHERHAYLDEQAHRLLKHADHVGTRLVDELQQLTQTARFLSRTPPPRGIVRAANNDGLDPLENVPLGLWRKRMESIFSAFAESHPSYYQIRLIGVADQGQELVRVDLHNGQASAVAVEKLQRKGERDYFQRSLELSPGEIYLSEINLNWEHGRVEMPHRRTLRAVAPIFNGDELFGFIVVNQDIGVHLDHIGANAPAEVKVFLTNAKGDFLVHPNNLLSFGFDTGERYRSIDLLPGLRLPDQATSDTWQSDADTIQTLSTKPDGVYAIARNIRFRQPQIDRNFTLVYTFTEQAVRSVVEHRARPILTGLILVALIVALLANRLIQKIFSPLGKLTAVARLIGDGDYQVALPPAGTGEIGAFVRAFQEMLNRIRERETENVRLNAELRQSEMFANSVVETTPEAILVVDPRGRMVRVNSKAEQLFEYTAEELIDQPVEILLPQSHRMAHKSLRQGYMAKAAQRVMGEGRSLQGQRKSGKTFPVEIDLGPLRIGNDQFVIACVLDITKRKEAEDRLATLNATLEQQVLERTTDLRKALALQQAVFDHAGLSLITTDSKGIITTFNPAAETMLGYQSSEVVDNLSLTVMHDPAEIDERARSLSEELQQEISPGFDALIAKSLVAQADTYEWTYRRKDGSCLPVLASMTALRNAEQQVFGYLGIAADLTERKEKEEQLRLATSAAEAASRAKSDFLANMSHEIRTPMNGVVGLTKILQDTALDRQQQNLLEKLDSSSNALLSILNDILDYSKIEAGKVAIEQVEFQLDELLDSSAALFAQSAETKGIEILLQVAPDVPQVLFGDPLRLSQVLNNLLGNAVKFTEQGHIHVSVTLGGRERHSNERTPTASLRFEVRDTGIGMSHDQQEQLFQAFHQADTSITRKYGGTGLGLSISQKLVALMKGEIGVESSQGKGSVFWFTVELNELRKKSGRNRELGQLRGMKVLAVDDQQTSLEILAEVLQAWEFEVELADSAAAGFEKLLLAEQQGQPFELFLIDWKMPGIDGMVLTQRIEELIEEGRITRAPIVVMVTAYGHDQVLEAAGSLRLDAVLDKPVTSSRLFDTLVGIQTGQMPAHTELAKVYGDDSWQRTLPIHGAYVLLVEDNATNQFIATQFLNKMALRIDVAKNGREAVGMVDKNNYDAVLMDLQMPIMDGLEATRIIRTTAKGRDLPIVAMTAAAMLKDREATEAAGMNAHIAKPIDLDELIATLLIWIKPTTIAASISTGDATTISHADQAFELPGLNLAAAVGHLDNSWSSLRKVLKAFQLDFKDATRKLHEDLENRRYEDAKRLAHTIKGLAHNIGAEALEASARRFEQDLVHGRVDTLNDFEQDLDAALTSISQVPDAPDAIDEELRELDTLAITELSALLCELSALVNDSIIVPAALKDRVRAGLRGHVSDPTIEKLLARVNQLDYASAHRELTAIADQTGIDLAS